MNSRRFDSNISLQGLNLSSRIEEKEEKIEEKKLGEKTELKKSLKYL
jgi:hypothetical protein